MQARAIKWFSFAGDSQLRDLVGTQDRIETPAGFDTPADDFQGFPKRYYCKPLHRFRDEWPADGYSRSHLVRGRGLLGHFEVAFLWAWVYRLYRHVVISVMPSARRLGKRPV